MVMQIYCYAKGAIRLNLNPDDMTLRCNLGSLVLFGRCG